jgi:O-antigen ligase
VSILAILIRDQLDVGMLEVAAVVALSCFALWTVLTIAWAGNATEPVLSLERVLVYVAFLPAMFLVSPRKAASLVLAGVLVAVSAVCAYALATRLLPGTLQSFPSPDGLQLEAPIGYWNGLGILAATGALVAWGLAANATVRSARALASAAVPALLTTLYFTFSRGSWVALALGLGVAIAAERRPLHFLVLLAASAPTAGVALLVATHSPALSRAGASAHAASAAGHRLAVVLFLCVAAAGALGWAAPIFERRIHIGPRVRRAVGAFLVGVVVLACAGVVARAGGPVKLVSRATASFRAPLPANGGDLSRRLVSLSSNGRSEYWRVAWREVVAHPWLGGGAGSYERYWHRGRRTAYEARNAHNLYLETLAELGPVGLGLLLVALGLPFAALPRVRGQPAAVAGGAAYAAVLAHAAIDWDWQLPTVTLAALACGGSVLISARPNRAGSAVSGRARVVALGVLLPLVAFAIVTQVGNSALAGSVAALDRQGPASAARLAVRARDWAPWSSQPWQRLGEAQLASGNAAGARRSFRHAISINPTDWSLWSDKADAESGASRREALARAARLNPLGSH